MRKVAVGGMSIAVLTGVVLAAFLLWGPGAQGVSWADMTDALRGVSTVHVTGDTAYTSQNAVIPLALHKDKWVRREPFAVYEEVTPVDPGTPEEATRRYIFAGDAAKVYWYFPERGNRAFMSKGLQTNFMDDVLAPLGWTGSAGSEPRFNLAGKSRLDSTKVILLELVVQGQRMEVAVDAKTKLTLRLRQFAAGAGGEQIEATRLRFEYDKTPPEGVFDWEPPAGATVVDRR